MSQGIAQSKIGRDVGRCHGEQEGRIDVGFFFCKLHCGERQVDGEIFIFWVYLPFKLLPLKRPMIWDGLCVRLRVCVFVFVRMGVCAQACVLARVLMMCVCACPRACVYVCLCLCLSVCVCVRACEHACAPAHMHTCAHFVVVFKCGCVDLFLLNLP